MAKTKVFGGNIIAKLLREEGVDKAFGIVDGTYVHLLSGLRKEKIELISPRHETSALHIAGTYARITGKLGVCIASNGPGVANALPGVAVENAEGNRVLLITSSRRTGIGYPDRGGTYQYFNHVGSIKPMSKWSVCIPSFERIPELMRRALRKCYQGRPGVVHVDVPENIVNSKIEDMTYWNKTQYRNTILQAPSAEQIAIVAKILLQSNYCVIHAGSGIAHSQAFQELETLTEKLKAIVTTSWSARGCIRENIDYTVPITHLSLSQEVHTKADVVLAIGTRFGETDWWGKPPYWNEPKEHTTIQVDIDEENIGLNKPVDHAILSDAKVFLQLLIEEIDKHQEQYTKFQKKRVQYIQKIKATRDSERQTLHKKTSKRSKKNTLHSGKVAEICSKAFPEDSIAILDGGNTAVWGSFYHIAYQYNALFSTFKMGMLGAGVAQAIGSAIAKPNQKTYCLIGDGAMGFHPQEVETSVRSNLNITYVVFCDKQWGMVKMTQQFAYHPIKTIIKKSLNENETINADFREIDFAKLAESMGAFGFRVSSEKQLKEAIAESINSKGTTVIHVEVDPVNHMWAPGLIEFKKMHLEPKK